MDYFEEYLSIVQSLKSYHAPSMELHVEVSKISNLSQDSSIKTISSTSPVAEITPLKKPNMQRDTRSPEPINTPIIPTASDNPFQTTMRKALPKHIFYEYPPVGISLTKKLPSQHLPAVPVFFYEENPSDQKFLTNLIFAIQDKFGVFSAPTNAKEIEECNLWRSVISMNHLQCVIVYDTWIASSPHGRCWYRADPNTNNCFLGTIPLIVLSSKADWYRDIENKKVLWNQLCRILKKPFCKTIA